MRKRDRKILLKRREKIIRELKELKAELRCINYILWKGGRRR